MCYTTPAGLLSYFVILCQPYTTFPVQTSSALRRMITYTDRERDNDDKKSCVYPSPPDGHEFSERESKQNKICIFFLAEINNFVYFIHLTKFITYLLLLLLLTMFCFFSFLYISTHFYQTTTSVHSFICPFLW